jgi:hypothetical protein
VQILYTNFTNTQNLVFCTCHYYPKALNYFLMNEMWQIQICSHLCAVACFMYDVFTVAHCRAIQIMITVSNDLKRMCKDEVVTYCEVLSQYIADGTA